MEEENTAGTTVQMIGAGALGFAVVSLVLSIMGGTLGACCCPVFGAAASVVSGLSALFSAGAAGYGVMTAKDEDLSEEQQSKAKMGAGLGAGGLVLSLIAVVIACGPWLASFILRIGVSLM